MTDDMSVVEFDHKRQNRTLAQFCTLFFIEPLLESRKNTSSELMVQLDVSSKVSR